MVQGIGFSAHGTTYHITDLGEGYVGGINELGQITGVSGGSAYIYDGGVFSWIDPPGPGSIFPSDINIDGEIVGRYNYVGDHVFLFDGSESINLGRFGGEMAYGKAINSFGQIVGAYKPSGSGMRAFIYSDGSFQDLGLLGTTGYSVATAINSHGKVAGQSTGIGGVDRAFYYDGSKMQDLGTLGFEPSSRRSYGTDINDAGHVVGSAHNSGYRYRAFLWDGNQMNDLGSLGDSSTAYAINSADVVVGSFELSDMVTEHAFVHDGTQMLDLNDLLIDGTGWVLTKAIDINSNGWIVGYGDLDGEQHSFLLTPEDSNVTPTVTVTSPSDGATYSEDDGAIALTATATDPEDGDISAGIQWASSVDGAITSPAALSVGAHTITASVIDDGGLTGTNAITVTITAHVAEGYKLSKNADFSTDDQEFAVTDTMYMKIWSDNVDYTNMKKAEYEIKVGRLRVKGRLTNHYEGTFSGSAIMAQIPFGSATVKLKLEDKNRKKYEVKDIPITVTSTD